MPKVCEICLRGPVFGRNISHSHRVTSRKMRPNLQRVKIKQNGGHRFIWICTRCLRSGRVEKAA